MQNLQQNFDTKVVYWSQKLDEIQMTLLPIAFHLNPINPNV